MKSKIFTILLVGCMAGVAHGAEGVEEAKGTEGTAYMVFGGVTGFDNFNETGVSSNVDESWGVQMRGGYRFNDYFALEGEIDLLTGFDTDLDAPAADPSAKSGLSLDNTMFMVNAKAYLPVGIFEPYAMLGAGVMWAQVRTSDRTLTDCWITDSGEEICIDHFDQLGNATEFAIHGGLGLNMMLTDHWGMSLECAYVKPYGDLSKFEYVSLGWAVKYSFK